MKHTKGEEFLLGYATVGDLPEIDSVAYVTVIALAFADGFISELNWDTETGLAVLNAIAAQDEDFLANMRAGYLIWETKE